MIKPYLLFLFITLNLTNVFADCSVLYSNSTLSEFDKDRLLLTMVQTREDIMGAKINNLPDGLKINVSLGSEGTLNDVRYRLINRKAQNVSAPSFVRANPFGLIPAVAIMKPNNEVDEIFLESQRLNEPFSPEYNAEYNRFVSEVGLQAKELIDKVQDYVSQIPGNKELYDSQRALIGVNGPYFNVYSRTQLKDGTWIVRVWGIQGYSLLGTSAPNMNLYMSNFHVGLTVIIKNKKILILPDHDLRLETVKNIYLQEVKGMFDLVDDPDHRIQGSRFHVTRVEDRTDHLFHPEPAFNGNVRTYSPSDYYVTMAVFETGGRIGGDKDGGGIIPATAINPQASKDEVVRFFGGFYSSNSGLKVNKLPKD